MRVEPPELTAAEIPMFVTNDDELVRWRLCVGITRMIAQRDDHRFARELFFGDIATDGPPPDSDPHT